MKILGIGNAIVDVLCKVSDEFLTQHSLTKSTMKLIDEVKFKNLLTSLKIEETISGGSVANSIVGLSQLGNEVGFIGKISDDNFGIKYEEGLIKENVKIYLTISLAWIILIGYLTWWNGLKSPMLDKSFRWDEWFWFGIVPAVSPYLFYYIWKKKE